ncbi:MAG TPA: hypothetical protein VF054_03090 [Micromonosporaceae bacterium]
MSRRAVRSRNPVAEWVRDLGNRTRRTSPGVVSVRLAVAVCALVGLTLAAPDLVLSGRYTGFAVLLALLPALAPRGPWTTLLIVVAALAWYVTSVAVGTPVTYWRVVALAAALYLTHTFAALSAALPYDTVVDPSVLLRWSARAGVVVGGTALVGAVIAVVPAVLGAHPSLSAALGGIAVGVVVLLTLLGLARR